MKPSHHVRIPREPEPATDRADDPSALRSTLASLQSDAEEFGRTDLARAFHRLVLMTEVWECLRDGSPEAAAELSAFCTMALDKLTEADPTGDASLSAWVIRESSERWGEYLDLMEPADGSGAESGQLSADEGTTAGASEPDDRPSAIDASMLLRLLTGAPTEPGPAPKPHKAAPDRGAAAEAPSPTTGDPWGLLGIDPPAPSVEPVGSSEGPAKRFTIGVPPPPSEVTIDPEMRETFLAEAADLFERIETLVLSLNKGRRQDETLHELGRCFHTLKGAAGSVELSDLASVVHVMEEQLETLDGQVSDDLVDSLHRLLHYIEGVFEVLKGHGGAVHGPVQAKAPPQPPRPSREEPLPAPVAAAAPRPEAPPAVAAKVPTPRTSATRPAVNEGDSSAGPVRVSSERVDDLMDIVSELISRRGFWAAQSESMKDFATMARTCRGRLMATIDRIRDLQPSYQSGRIGGHGRDAFDRQADVPELIRRLVEQSDDLIVLTESARSTAKPLSDNSDALARLTLQLWESLQAIRIVPVRGLFQRLMRVAHDAARVEGRQVEVVTVGEETGLDRAVQDKAFEPLLHVVRNAVCHGIEPADERIKKGKPPCGRVTLEASRTGNTLLISVQDDGRGLDYEAIASKARRLGLIGPDDRPGIDRLNALVFQSGFSTREAANAIAGRGVGMDVVSQEVARLHGSVALASQQGLGTRLTIALPARLALEQAMVLRVDGQAFALPVELIEQVQPFDPADVDGSGPRPLVRMRDQPVPLLSAREALGFPPAAAVSCPKVLLVRAEGEPLAMLVDAIDGTRELVIKPLGALLTGHPAVSGTSLSVTGEVIFALSPSGLARWRREGCGAPGSSNGRGHGRADRTVAAKSAPVLVVDDSISVRKVVTRQLHALGYDVEEVSDGLEALGRVRNNEYCLVVSDLEMPRMDGFELLAELSRLTISPALPVLIASTRTDVETRRRVMGLGARGFLSKPIAPEELAVSIESLLGERASAAGPELRRQSAPSGVS